MKQVIQNLKNGELAVKDVPPPSISEGWVLVETHYSLISAGTEKGTVETAKKSLLGKAQKRPDLVKQVLHNIQKEGIAATIQKVRTKLDSPKALGYSCAGVVIASNDTNNKFKPGDRVACAGQDFASHAEMVAVPQNLVAKMPEGVDFAEAAFVTLGTIALQGVRQAALTLGERVCVIGLGLLGQLTAQLVEAHGCTAFGIDVDEHRVEAALTHGLSAGCMRAAGSLMQQVNQKTGGRGFDAVIITAATQSADPIVLAGEITRKKGCVVVVGDVSMDIPRNPHYYRKELDVRMSCSYGPGRYDPEYEECGNDYPFAYVRWTEARNMDAFLTLIQKKKIAVKELISHVFEIDDAQSAYDLIMGKGQYPFSAVLLHYPERVNKQKKQMVYYEPLDKDISIGFLGAGSFAQSYLLPTLKGCDCVLHTIVTQRGMNSDSVAQKFRFSQATADPTDIFHNKVINTVFVATRHDSHAHYVLESLRAGKHVFVEKPLALNEEQLDEIVSWHAEQKEGSGVPQLVVGYNRRFSQALTSLRMKIIENAAIPLVTYRVNAGYIPKEHWIQQSKVGGGRIVGEVCHFVDALQFLTGGKPLSVTAHGMSDSSGEEKLCDNCVITIRFDTGAVGTIVYTANGNTHMPKERIEIFSGGDSFVMNDFKEIFSYSSSGVKKESCRGKGHREEVQAFLQSLAHGNQPVIPFESLVDTSKATFCIINALRTGALQEI